MKLRTRTHYQIQYLVLCKPCTSDNIYYIYIYSNIYLDTYVKYVLDMYYIYIAQTQRREDDNKLECVVLC